MVKSPVGASEVFKNLSGKFVKSDGSGRVEIATAAAVNIVGWAVTGEITASATEGATKVGVNVNCEAVYEMPAILNAGTAPSEAALIAAVGETCDIKMVDTNYQYANVDTATTEILKIVDYRYYGSAVGQQTVLVQLNPIKAEGTGVV